MDHHLADGKYHEDFESCAAKSNVRALIFHRFGLAFETRCAQQPATVLALNDLRFREKGCGSLSLRLRRGDILRHKSPAL